MVEGGLPGQTGAIFHFRPYPPISGEGKGLRMCELVPHIVATFADPINKQQMFQHLPYLGATPPHGRRLARGSAPAGCGAEPREEKFAESETVVLLWHAATASGRHDVLHVPSPCHPPGQEALTPAAGGAASPQNKREA